MGPAGNNSQGRQKGGNNKIRVNRFITARQVRLVDPEGLLVDETGNADAELIGIMSRDDALRKAEALDLDLVEVSPNAKPPVVRIMDYGKFLFDEKKKRKKQKIVKLKEIKFRPVTEEGDYQVKLRNLMSFLASGDKVKVTIRFRGREITHQQIGMELLKRLVAEIGDTGNVEQMPKLEGRQLIMIVAPIKKNN
ncbi:MAG: translation initiation factor IF-3 [Legionellales bacterium]|nr:translation initiation factor IF-3 [Legionellales bacterium]|tara:strand:- start:1662 stop:2243 length:582 start_codon:yes stop_codon:yes gene_type:complete